MPFAVRLPLKLNPGGRVFFRVHRSAARECTPFRCRLDGPATSALTLPGSSQPRYRTNFNAGDRLANITGLNGQKKGGYIKAAYILPVKLHGEGLIQPYFSCRSRGSSRTCWASTVRRSISTAAA